MHPLPNKIGFLTTTTTHPPSPDRLYKVHSVIMAVLAACSTNYWSNRDLAIDKAMVAFKGRLLMKQYLPMQIRFKIWVCADSHNGYICQFECYTQLRVGWVVQVVNRLTRHLVGKKHGSTKQRKRRSGKVIIYKDHDTIYHMLEFSGSPVLQATSAVQRVESNNSCGCPTTKHGRHITVLTHHPSLLTCSIVYFGMPLWLSSGG
jgi:hypothetical protein